MAGRKKDIKTDVKQKKAAIKAKAEQLKAQGRKHIAKLKSLKTGISTNTVKDNRLELLITIVNRSKGEYYIDLLQTFDVNMQFVSLGHGTADADMMSKFGLTDSDKTVIFSFIQSNKIKDALYLLDRKFRTIKNGNGIAYTVPLSSVIGTLIFGFLSDNRMAVKQTDGV